MRARSKGRPAYARDADRRRGTGELAGIGEEVGRHQMDWRHLPIAEVSIWSVCFEDHRESAGSGLCARLRDGCRVLAHCNGESRRAGTIAARLRAPLGGIRQKRSPWSERAAPGVIEATALRKRVVAVQPRPPRPTKLRNAKQASPVPKRVDAWLDANAWGRSTPPGLLLVLRGHLLFGRLNLLHARAHCLNACLHDRAIVLVGDRLELQGKLRFYLGGGA